MFIYTTLTREWWTYSFHKHQPHPVDILTVPYRAIHLRSQWQRPSPHPQAHSDSTDEQPAMERQIFVLTDNYVVVIIVVDCDHP